MIIDFSQSEVLLTRILAFPPFFLHFHHIFSTKESRSQSVKTFNKLQKIKGKLRTKAKLYFWCNNFYVEIKLKENELNECKAHFHMSDNQILWELRFRAMQAFSCGFRNLQRFLFKIRHQGEPASFGELICAIWICQT